MIRFNRTCYAEKKSPKSVVKTEKKYRFTIKETAWRLLSLFLFFLYWLGNWRDAINSDNKKSFHGFWYWISVSERVCWQHREFWFFFLLSFDGVFTWSTHKVKGKNYFCRKRWFADIQFCFDFQRRARCKNLKSLRWSLQMSSLRKLLCQQKSPRNTQNEH